MAHQVLKRFHGYDYARGGSMFVTMGLAVRKPLFGYVDHERVVRSEAGETLLSDIREAERHFAGLFTIR